jgi:hypothetical protein
MYFSGYFICRPLSRPGGIARQTPTETDFCLRDLRRQKQQSLREAICSCLKGMRLLPGTVARAKMVCLRYVCEGLRLTDIIISNRYESSARKLHQPFWKLSNFKNRAQGA